MNVFSYGPLWGLGICAFCSFFHWYSCLFVFLFLFSNLLQLLLLSHFSHVWPCGTPWTAAHQAPPSLGFSRQEHWSGLPFPSPMHESAKWKWQPLSTKLIKLFFKFQISIFVFMWLNSPVFSLCFLFLTEVGNNNVVKMIHLHFWKT